LNKGYGWDLDHYTNFLDNTLNNRTKIPYTADNTNTVDAMNKAVQTLRGSQHARENPGIWDSLVVLVTDGRPNVGDPPSPCDPPYTFKEDLINLGAYFYGALVMYQNMDHF
jgi:hypothetical protein